MGQTGRFVVFLGIVLGVWTGFHLYAFHRFLSVPGLARLLPVALRWPLALLLWLSYPLGRALAHRYPWGRAVEWAGAAWMGVLFLTVSALLAADLVTGFGRLWPSATLPARTAALAVAWILSVAALVQGLLPPRVVKYEVRVDRLPGERGRLRVVQISDLHLGTLLGESWLERRVGEVAALSPDLLLVTGDLVDGSVGEVRPLVPVLRRLEAPLGVWGVTGNHEFYAGLERSLALYEEAGIRVLRDGWAEAAPGLVLSGVDDLTARRQLGLDGRALDGAFRGIPAGSLVLYLSHSPLRVGEAARLGARVMFSGHTHGGQIWPFTYLAAVAYPHQAGRYALGGMDLIVSRGTGTWGPRMRLFRRSEIVVVDLVRAV